MTTAAPGAYIAPVPIIFLIARTLERVLDKVTEEMLLKDALSRQLDYIKTHTKTKGTGNKKTNQSIVRNKNKNVLYELQEL